MAMKIYRRPPVYPARFECSRVGTRFTLALVKKRLDEAGLLESDHASRSNSRRLVEIGRLKLSLSP